MAHTSSEGRKRIDQGIMLAYLLQLNRYALQKGLITEAVYREMEMSMMRKYSMRFS